MSDPETTIRNRYFAMAATRVLGSAGAMFGLVLIGRADATLPKVIGIAIVLSALLCIAIVPRALARRWRTPPGE